MLETLFIDVNVVANVVITAISVSDQGNKDCSGVWSINTVCGHLTFRSLRRSHLNSSWELSHLISLTSETFVKKLIALSPV